MRTSKERKEIEYFNEHVYNEANKILPEDSESTMNAKIMAENLIVNIILDSPFKFKFPNSADWFQKKREEIKAEYPEECKYFHSAFLHSKLLEELEPMYLASDTVPSKEKDLYLKVKRKNTKPLQ
ncbi:MAG: hypothetical protein IPO06_22630 [Leptospiraceae bacterium]|nr:hypothetical protein [Leptospiraceae bacterium]MBK9502119.1 hypothetical protein [Leptospiraceae bacterium]